MEGMTTEQNENFREEEKMILVQSRNVEFQNEGGRCYSTAEYHMVDLERNEIHLRHWPTLLQFVQASTIVALDRFIYTFGGLDSFVLESSDFKRLQSQSPNSHRKFFFGGSRLDLDQSQGGVWGPAPAPVENRCELRCTSLLGNIYDFGTGYLIPQVLDPSVGHWKPLCPLPPEFDGSYVSCSPLPDPSNHRILVHVSGVKLPAPSIYAFSPHPHSSGGTWKCIASNFYDWNPVVAVVDDVIYFHHCKFPSVLRAFDLAEGRWLKIHWSSCFENNVDLNNTRMAFHRMFPLGNRVLCLAVWSLIYPPDKKQQRYNEAKISFCKFRVERSGETARLVPLSFHSYVLPSTCTVREFLPV